MEQHYDQFGQPIGPPLSNWSARQPPPRTPMTGRFCKVEPLNPERHAEDLFAANCADAVGRNWSYLPEDQGPHPSLDLYRRWAEAVARSDDPLWHTIIDSETGRATGVAAYARIDRTSGVIEVGGINYSPHLQRRSAATEAIYLMMHRVFDELGYRRYEWKCDSLNAPSRTAALRLGFRYEGLFRQAVVYKGRSRDTAWFSVIDSEWPAFASASNDGSTRLISMRRVGSAPAYPASEICFSKSPEVSEMRSIDKPIVFGAPYSVYVRAVRLALEEKGVDYELVPVDIFASDGRPAEHLARHPFGKIPAFEHAGFQLYEAGAIMRYVDEVFVGPPLQPADPRSRARMNQITSILDSYAYRTLVWDIYVERIARPANGVASDEGKIAAALPKAEVCLSALSELMDEAPWLAGPVISLADLHAAPILAALLHCPEGQHLICRHDRLAEWWRRVSTRPSFVRTRVPPRHASQSL